MARAQPLTCLAQLWLLLCGAAAYVPAFSAHRLTRPAWPSAARLALPVAAAAPTSERTDGDGRRAPRRKESAANALLQKLDALRSTRSVPVDATALSGLVRPLADGLRGPMLLEVLGGLRKRGKWEMALALAQMVEANAPAAPPSRPKPRYAAPAAPAPVDAPAAGRKQNSAATSGVPEMAGPAGRNSRDSRGGAAGGGVGVRLVSPEDSDTLLARARAAAAAAGDYSGDGYSEDDSEDSEDGYSGDGYFGGGYSGEGSEEGSEWGGVISSGPPVDTVHYNVLLSTLAMARRWREALELLTRMRERSVPRDTVRNRAHIASEQANPCPTQTLPPPIWDAWRSVPRATETRYGLHSSQTTQPFPLSPPTMSPPAHV